MPNLITFDIFGTVLDWKTGLENSCASVGRALQPGEFDRIIDRQAEIQAEGFHTYDEILERSFVDILSLSDAVASAVANSIGDWPLYPDAGALQGLMAIVPCAALTNSDMDHGIKTQASLGFKLSDWLCAEEVGLYKPDPGFWRAMATRRNIDLGPNWWHVSAYADYDLGVANDLGLTTVFVPRPHSRKGEATLTVESLFQLVDLARKSA
jgi:FMN phosphatase YigB (HAD superfamily)